MAAAGRKNPGAAQKAQAQLARLIRDEVSKFVPERATVAVDHHPSPPSVESSQNRTET